MATKTFEELKQMAIQIRDEKANKQNTATRIGTQMLEHLNKLEQDFLDKDTTEGKFSELSNECNIIRSNTSLINNSIEVSYEEGDGYMSSLSDLSFGNFGKHRTYSVIPENKQVRISITGNRGDGYCYLLTDIDDNIIEAFRSGDFPYGYTFKKYDFITKLYASIQENATTEIEIGDNYPINKKIRDLEKNIQLDFSKVKKTVGYYIYLDKTENGKYLYSEGVEVELSAYNIAYYNILQNISSIHVTARIGTSAYIIFFDANGNILSKYAGNDSSGINIDSDFVVPDGSVTVGVSYVNSYSCTVEALEEGIAKQIKDFDDEVRNIKNYIGCYIYLDKTENGKYLNSEGVESEMNSYNIVYYKILQHIDSIHITARIGVSAYIVFLNINGDILSKYAGNDSSGINIDSDFVVPDGSVTVGVSYVNSYSCTVEALEEGIAKQLQDIKNETGKGKDFISSLKGGKIGAVGDSIMSGASASTESERFINVFADLVGCTVNNVAIGGWTYMSETENTGFWQQVNGTGDATKSLDGDEDLIVISGLTNDFGHANPIGDYYRIVDNGTYKKRVSTEEQYRNSVCGGIHKLIKTLYDKYNGYIPIIICLPIHRVLGGSKSGGSWESNSLGLYIDDYCTAVRKVAEYYGIPVFDTFNLCGLNPNIDIINEQYFADGLHPKSNGHKIIGTGLYNFAKNLCIPLSL